MMPLSVAALVSGMLTLVATAPNLVVNAELARHGMEGFRFFSFTPFGLPVLILGIIYMVFARRMLASEPVEPTSASRRPSLQTWIDQYQAGRPGIPGARDSRIADCWASASKSFPLRAAGMNIVAIVRNLTLGTEMIRPVAQTELQVDDVLLVDVLAPEIEIAATSRTICARCLCRSATTADTSPTHGTKSAWSRRSFHTELATDRPDRTGGQSSRGTWADSDRPPARSRGALDMACSDEKLKIGDTLAARRLLGRHQAPARRRREHGRAQHAGRTGRRAAGCEQSTPRAGGARSRGRVDGQRHCAKRAGCPDRMPPHGSAWLRRSEQRLSVDQLEEPHTDRRDDAVLSRAATDRRCRSGGRRDGGLDRQRRTARRDGNAVRHNGVAGPVHLEHRDGRADGPHRACDRWRSPGLAISVCDDRGIGGIVRVHDTDLLAGEHARGRTRQLCIRRFRQDRRAIHHRRPDRQRLARALVAAAVPDERRMVFSLPSRPFETHTVRASILRHLR